MNFEGVQPHKNSIDSILEKLDNKNHFPGEKNIKRISLEDGTVLSLDTVHKTVSYTENNVTTQATIDDGLITHIVLTNPHSGNEHNDAALTRVRKKYIQKCINSQVIPF